MCENAMRRIAADTQLYYTGDGSEESERASSSVLHCQARSERKAGIASTASSITASASELQCITVHASGRASESSSARHSDARCGMGRRT